MRERTADALEGDSVGPRRGRGAGHQVEGGARHPVGGESLAVRAMVVGDQFDAVVPNELKLSAAGVTVPVKPPVEVTENGMVDRQPGLYRHRRTGRAEREVASGRGGLHGNGYRLFLNFVRAGDCLQSDCIGASGSQSIGGKCEGRA